MTVSTMRRCACAEDAVAGLFHATYEHLAPTDHPLAVAVSLAKMHDMPRWRREATARALLDAEGRRCRPRAACCRRVLDRWMRVEVHRAA